MVVRRNRIIICTMCNGYWTAETKDNIGLVQDQRPALATYTQVCVRCGRPTTAYGLFEAVRDSVACSDSPQLNVWAYMDAFVEKWHFFITTTAIYIKTNRSPGHGHHASARQISPSYDVASRRSLETENKQTVNYYIDQNSL